MDDVLYQVGRGGRNGEGLGFGWSWDRKRLLHALCSSLVNNFRIVNAAPLRAGAAPRAGPGPVTGSAIFRYLPIVGYQVHERVIPDLFRGQMVRRGRHFG